MEYYSEYGQDKWLEENVFKGKRLGIFVEVGALDGVFHSNTCFFERERGWKGVCIEPNPSMYSELCMNREMFAINCAVSSVKGFVNFRQIEGNLRGWSGIVDFMEPEHLERIKDRVSREKIKYNDIKVISCKLEDIISPNVRVDYLSIDVEGAEKSILTTFPFDKRFIDVVEVEVNFDNSINELMNSKGYTLLTRLGVSNIYRRNNGYYNNG